MSRRFSLQQDNCFGFLRNERGVVFVGLAIVMATLIAAMTLAGYVFVNSAGDQTYAKLDSDRVTIVADGLVNAGKRLLDEYFKNTVNPDTAEMAALLKTQLQPLIDRIDSTQSIKISEVEITQGAATSAPAVISFSVFKGMLGKQNKYYVNMRFTKVSGGLGGNDVVVTNAINFGAAQIYLFRFSHLFMMKATFAGSGYATYQGHVHVNDDLCLGSDSVGVSHEHFYDRVTVSGRALLNNDPACRGIDSFTANAFINIVDPFNPTPTGTPINPTQFAQFVNGGTSGCMNCEGSQLNWQQYALEKFHGHLLDVAHGVPKVSFPGLDTAQVQPGSDEDLLTIKSNQTMLRMFVDPVRPTDDVKVKSLKFAALADIRIIDGIWYLRDTTNPSAWPGLPIWSDHPGNYTVNGIAVGQSDIAAARGWSTANPPKRFSFYEYQTGAATVSDSDQSGIISYGALRRSSSGGTSEPWFPAHYVDGTVTGNSICPSSTITSMGEAMDPPLHSARNQLASSAIQCGTGPVPYSTALLNATRGGFQSPTIRYWSKPEGAVGWPTCAHPVNDNRRWERSKMLSMNFNVRQFRLALQDTARGELGSYFSATRPFNGIVYVSADWTENGYNQTTAFVAEPPLNGNNPDANQILPTSTENTQQALPKALCTSTPALINTRFDRGNRFKIPSCALSTVEINTLRVFNGEDLPVAELPQGLSIVSNLPVHLMGNYNSRSNFSAATGTPWVPALIAGDTVHLFSDNWSDETARWSYYDEIPVSFCFSPTVPNPSYATARRNAVDTKYVTSFLTSSISENEDWSGKTRSLIGSQVTGFYPVFYRVAPNAGALSPTAIYHYVAPGVRDVQFDPHLNLYQPPGSPAFSVLGIIQSAIP